MTRLTITQAQRLGILPDKKKPAAKQTPKNMPGRAKWDAKTIPGGVWLQIPEVPPSLNVWKNWHWSKQGQFKNYLTDAVRGLVMALKLPRYHKAVVQIIYYCKTKRRRDPSDNYAPKFLMDALVQGGILVDDSGDLVDVAPVKIELDREGPRTEIFIWEQS